MNDAAFFFFFFAAPFRDGFGPRSHLRALEAAGWRPSLRRPGAASAPDSFLRRRWRRLGRIFRKSHERVQAIASRVLHAGWPSRQQISARAVLEGCRSERDHGVLVESTREEIALFLKRAFHVIFCWELRVVSGLGGRLQHDGCFV